MATQGTVTQLEIPGWSGPPRHAETPPRELLLLDLENVRCDPTSFASSTRHCRPFLGRHQSAPLSWNQSARSPWIDAARVRRTSKNAVDLRIAEALGQAHETYGGETGFTVVSGDQDFDAVLAHLAIELGRCARRTSEVRPRMSSPARSTNPKRFRDDFFGPDIDHVHIVDHSGDNPRVRPDTLPGDDWRAIVFGHEDVSTGDPWKAAGMFERARFVGLRGSRKHTREFFLALYLGRLHAACDDDVRFTLHSDTDLLDELITSYWERRRLVSRAAPPRKPQKKRAPRKRMTTLERWDHEEGGVVNECFARGRLKNWFRGQPYRKKKTNEALADLRRHGRII